MNLLLMFQSIRNPVFDVLANIFTLIGEQYFIMVVFCWLAWCGDKRFALKTGFAFCLGMGINQVLKLMFCVQRPWVLDKRITPLEGAVEGATGYSFPSGHTQSGTTFFGCLALHYKNVVFKTICIVCAIMVGLSRIYLGVHTPADVAASFLIGIAVIFVSERLFALCEKYDVVTLVSGVLISVMMVAFALLKPYPAYHIPEYAYDCIKIAGAISGFITGWFLERRFVRYSPSGSKSGLVIKTIVGLALLVMIKIALKALFEQTYFIMYAQNFVLIMWCVFIYPYILKKLKDN